MKHSVAACRAAPVRTGMPQCTGRGAPSRSDDDDIGWPKR